MRTELTSRAALLALLLPFSTAFAQTLETVGFDSADGKAKLTAF